MVAVTLRIGAVKDIQRFDATSYVPRQASNLPCLALLELASIPEMHKITTSPAGTLPFHSTPSSVRRSAINRSSTLHKTRKPPVTSERSVLLLYPG